jgi:hypothetical protein
MLPIQGESLHNPEDALLHVLSAISHGAVGYACAVKKDPGEAAGSARCLSGLFIFCKFLNLSCAMQDDKM